MTTTVTNIKVRRKHLKKKKTFFSSIALLCEITLMTCQKNYTIQHSLIQKIEPVVSRETNIDNIRRLK